MIRDIEEIKDLTGSNNYLKLYRVDFMGYRLYVQDNPFMYFSGLTGALDKSTFKGDHDAKRLNKWRESMIENLGSRDSVDQYVESTADFGTLLHMAAVTIRDNKKIVWNEERDKAEAYFSDMFIKQGRIPDKKIVNEMVFSYHKHISSLAQFIYERVDEIYAIEVPAIWQSTKIATPIDLVVSCRQTPKGEFSKTCINIKTSSQVTNKHMDQASCEFVMWNETYPHVICENTAILRTKEWTDGKTPTYDYKYLDGGEAMERALKIEQKLLFCLEESNSSYYPNPVFKKFTGEIKLGEMPTIETISIEQEWKQR